MTPRLVWNALLAVWPMVRIEVGLRTADLPAVCRHLGLRCDLQSAASPPDRPATLPAEARATVRACRAVAARWPAGDTCLRRCLLIGHRLRHLEPVLRIGVRRDPHGVFSAHSWLEIAGGTLDPTASRYAALGAPDQ
jgi:Transglutaminase-like superfamily